MKIAVLGTRGFPNIQGGVEAHCENLYPYLVKKGCEVVVFTRSPYAEPSIREYKGVRLVSLWATKNKFMETLLHTFFGIFAAKKIKPDILHIHAIGPSFFAPLARFLGLKVVVTNHGPDYDRKKWGRLAKQFLKAGERLGCVYSNKTIAISNHIAETIRRKYGKTAIVIPNGVAPAAILKTEKALQDHGLERGKYILAVGRFVPEKGFHDLMAAFKNLQLKGWKLAIVGMADHRSQYSIGLEEDAKTDPNIILTGFLTGKPLHEIYGHAGLFVLPSYHEGLPLVLLEAMSHGLLCVVSDIPANREIALSEDRFFKPGDVKNLSDKIDEFINKPMSEEEKRDQIKFITEKYGWDDIARRTMQVYEKAMTEVSDRGSRR